MASNGYDTVLFFNFKLQNGCMQMPSGDANNNSESLSHGYYQCICNTDSKTVHTDCVLLEAAKKKNLGHHDKLYGIFGSSSESGLTWKEFFGEHYNITFDPSLEYIIIFDSGDQVHLNDKISEFLDKSGGSHTVVDIVKIPKSNQNNLSDAISEPDEQMSLSNCETPSQIMVYGAKMFPNSESISLSKFGGLFD